MGLRQFNGKGVRERIRNALMSRKKSFLQLLFLLLQNMLEKLGGGREKKRGTQEGGGSQCSRRLGGGTEFTVGVWGDAC